MWRAALALLVVAGCGRLGFDVVPQVVDSGGGDGATDGPQTDGLATDTPKPACQTSGAYVAANGLTNLYREVTLGESFANARADCVADEADLWVVESTLEQNAFTGDWTGITDEAAENVWRKLDGTVATFLPFAAGEPDGGTVENCIRTDSGGFEDRDCADLRDYVCECPM